MTRVEYEARHKDLQVQLRTVVDLVESLRKQVADTQNQLAESRGAARILMYLVPILTGVIGFLADRALH